GSGSAGCHDLRRGRAVTEHTRLSLAPDARDGAQRGEQAPVACRTRTRCRSCESDRLHLFLSLGPMPLANAFLRFPEEFGTEPSFPLDVYLCGDCSLVQLNHVVDPEILFRNYIYVTGTSDTIGLHNRRYARAVRDSFDLGSEDLVVEIASNDGSLLKCFRELGVRTLGVEPARNIAALAREAGIDTVEEFFDSARARAVVADHGPAAAVIANNVLAHVDDVRDFLLGCLRLLRPGGRLIVEVPYLGELLNRLEYDTIYHEHLCYFSVTALMRLYEVAELSIERIERVPVHGGGLRVFARPRTECPRHGESVVRMAEREAGAGLADLARFERFAREVRANRDALLSLLGSRRGGGRQLAGYGAPAKGNTLLNFCGIGPELLPYVVDRNPMKVGTYTPGTHIPVRPVATLAERRPDDVLILAWNFADEIMNQQSAYREAGGRFLVPIPQPRVV
ncbi:MAG: methyltransferase domain-containing protein, partial [Gemmatimonadota bacterium]